MNRMDILSVLREAIRLFLVENGWSLFWIFAIVFGGRLLLSVAVRRIIRRGEDGNDEQISGREKRARTLADLVSATGNVALILVGGVMVLRLLGVDPMPILAGASVLGFGIGFGAQTLIKDLFAGVFIFAENQFAVGDRVKIGLTEGRVYKMSIRTTVVRDGDGNLVFIPNGTITTVINYSLGAKRTDRFARPKKEKG